MSPRSGTPRPANQLLAALSDTEYKRILPHLQSITFALGETIYSVGERIQHVYFPTTSLISLLTSLESGDSVEVGVIGNEGVLGIHYALGSATSPNWAIAQIPGVSLRMKAEAFRAELARGGTLRGRTMNYISCMLSMVSQTVACNRVHRLDQRLSRLLLTVRDRAESDQFVMTHEFMARMLGTSRSEVTKAAGMLKRRRLIRYAYGSITLLDRARLEAGACECYLIVKQIYQDVLNGKR